MGLAFCGVLVAVGKIFLLYVSYDVGFSRVFTGMFLA